MENKYNLLGLKRDIISVEELLDQAIERFRVQIEAIEKAFPHQGLGDTDVDEAITHYIYNAIH